MKNVIYKIGLFAVLAINLFSYASEVKAQGLVESRVTDASMLLAEDYRKGAEKFKEIGPESIPVIVRRLTKDYSAQDKLFKYVISPLLVSVINEFETATADDALVSLTGHKNGLVRGRAIQLIGIRKQHSAIPTLIRVLNDKSVYVTNHTSHGPSKEVLFRDVAVESLEKITGKTLAPKCDFEMKAKEWKNWWKLNESNFEKQSKVFHK